MACASDSTNTPSRRAFFGSAVGAGVAAAQPPIVTGAMFAADAALVALGAKFATLYAASEEACNRQSDAEEIVFAALPNRPVRPGDFRKFACDRDWHEALEVYEAECVAYDQRRASAEAAVGLAALVRASRKAAAAAAAVLEEAKQVRATTFEGLVAKARMADQWDDPTMVASVMGDLLRCVPETNAA